MKLALAELLTSNVYQFYYFLNGLGCGWCFPARILCMSYLMITNKYKKKMISCFLARVVQTQSSFDVLDVGGPLEFQFFHRNLSCSKWLERSSFLCIFVLLFFPFFLHFFFVKVQIPETAKPAVYNRCHHLFLPSCSMVEYLVFLTFSRSQSKYLDILHSLYVSTL